MRTMAWIMMGTVLAGCSSRAAGKTFVYAIDGAPQGTIDPARCAEGVGLDFALGFDQSIGYTVEPDGRTAYLTSCLVDEQGRIEACGRLVPETLLRLDGDRIVGSSEGRVELQDSTCTGGTIAFDYVLEVRDTNLDVEVEATWSLDNTFACEQLEAAVIEQAGRGITGCVVRFAFTGSWLAECDLTLGICDYER